MTPGGGMYLTALSSRMESNCCRALRSAKIARFDRWSMSDDAMLQQQLC